MDPNDAFKLQFVSRNEWKGNLLITPLPYQEGGDLTDPGKDIGDIRLIARLEGGNSEERRVVVSLGAREKINLENVRKAGGGTARWIIKNKIISAGLVLKSFDGIGLDWANATNAFCEGLLLGSFQFNRLKSEISEQPPTTFDLLIEPGHEHDLPGLEQKVNRTAVVAQAVNLARSWAHEPPNVINPVTLAERVRELADEHALKCTVIDEVQLKEMGANAILSVGKGSKTPSCLIAIEYPGADPTKQARPIVLVGKTITFDTGGYSLKDRAGMVGMKYDKCGGMDVIGILTAATRLKIGVPVIGIIAAAENMISGESYRPNDIIKTLSGKTVEVISADAEGRMVLCDALAYAQKQYQPRALIDLATLTGGVVVALGKLRAGIMSNSDALTEELVRAGEMVHERLWRLPLDDEYLEAIKGDDSDLKNSGSRDAHAIIGGIFLKQFVSDEVPWAHLDIAGMADTDKDLPYCPKGATGFGVRLILNYLENLL